MTYTRVYLYLAVVFHFGNRKRYKYEAHTHMRTYILFAYITL